MAKKRIEAEEENKVGPSSKDILGTELKDNKEFHYNFEKPVTYKVSSGSLLLDIEMDGGFGPGLHRFCGLTEGGKTSEMLQIMQNFLKTVPNSKAFYIKCEGRLSQEIQERYDIKFVYSAEEWEVGTCFVFECNIYEVVFGTIKRLIKENPNKEKFFFAVDSTDGLQLKDDSTKDFSEHAKMAGGANISARFMQGVSLALTKFGHMAFFLSQLRAEIKDQYEKRPVRPTNSSGGFALQHYPDWIFEFEHHGFKDDLILAKQKEKVDPIKNPILGHWVKAVIKKSTNEKTYLTVRYPIKYGRKKGQSIWIEKEVADLLEDSGYAVAKGAWINFSPELLEDLKKNNILDIPSQVNGSDKLDQLLESRKDFTLFLYKKLQKVYVGMKSPETAPNEAI